MGKKRKNIESIKKIATDDDPDDDDVSTLVYLYNNKFAVLLFMIVGFCIGSGLCVYFSVGPHNPQRFQTALSQWSEQVLGDARYSLNSFRNIIPSSSSKPSSTSSSSSSSGGIDISEVPYTHVDVNGRKVRDDASHPLAFAILREAIMRDDGGFVHPDLGLLIPAPSGATRGIGMVRDNYNMCQTRCLPGTENEKLRAKSTDALAERQGTTASTSPTTDATVDPTRPAFWEISMSQLATKEHIKDAIDGQQSAEEIYRQEEILIKVPLSYQMTRKLALSTLTPLIPAKVNQRAPLQELDDAAQLVLLLAHERGRGLNSKFLPYIKTLPISPSCGYSPVIRSQVLETISLMGIELDMDVNGWPAEITRAGDRAQMIADGLTKDYGSYISIPKGDKAFAVIQWALCQVASRATAGNEYFGALRLVPMIDMINHDVNAGGFTELAGHERRVGGDGVNIGPSEKGAFYVRSLRHGRRKPLKRGQELLANYNVPNYGPLDWYVSLGFVPPERMGRWQKVDAHFKKARTYATDL